MLKHTIKLLISSIFVIFDIVYFQVLKTFGFNIPGRWIILYYHYIDSDYLTNFKYQISRLSQNFTIIPTSYDGDLLPNKKYASITFDDGISSTISNVIPIMQHNQSPFTIFIPSDLCGTKQNFYTNKEPKRLNDKILSSDEINKLSNDPLVTIGSHCLTHKSLIKMTTEQAKHEITISKIALESITNHKVNQISFPFGEYCKEHVHIARNAGYKRIFSTEHLIHFDSLSDVMGRTRINQADSRYFFNLKLYGSYRWLPKVLKLKNYIMNQVF